MDTKRIEENEEEDIETLKKRISGHALFKILINRHLDCLKVSLGENIEEVETNSTYHEEAGDTQECNEEIHEKQLSPALDQLMEVHCVALEKLKEELEIQVQETLAFINDMHSHLH